MITGEDRKSFAENQMWKFDALPQWLRDFINSEPLYFSLDDYCTLYQTRGDAYTKAYLFKIKAQVDENRI